MEAKDLKIQSDHFIGCTALDPSSKRTVRRFAQDEGFKMKERKSLGGKQIIVDRHIGATMVVINLRSIMEERELSDSH